jgi:uncharacterized protein with PIN domain
VLTCDRGVLKRKSVTHGYLVRDSDPFRQAVEVVRRFDLCGAMSPFTRCMACNGELSPVAKTDVEASLEPKTRRYYNQFQQCTSCGRVYWKGSHHERLEQIVAKVRDACCGINAGSPS